MGQEIDNLLAQMSFMAHIFISFSLTSAPTAALPPTILIALRLGCSGSRRAKARIPLVEVVATQAHIPLLLQSRSVCESGSEQVIP